jgi:branched-chain amino acid transport system permease protein
MSALDTVAVARRAPLPRARPEAMHFLERVGLDADADVRVGKLPLGARRRVELARALALDPLVLMLDEPAAGLTAAEQEDLAARLRALADEGVALVVVEHNMPFLLTLADRLVCLDAGRVIAEGTPGVVRADPAVVEAYLGVP